MVYLFGVVGGNDVVLHMVVMSQRCCFCIYLSLISALVSVAFSFLLLCLLLGLQRRRAQARGGYLTEHRGQGTASKAGSWDLMAWFRGPGVAAFWMIYEPSFLVVFWLFALLFMLLLLLLSFIRASGAGGGWAANDFYFAF